MDQFQLLECKNIEVPAIDKNTRSFNKEFAVNLSQSIKAEGMFNPVLVRPNPNKPGFFFLVQGRHRLYAKKTVLKEQFIEAHVMADMDETEAEMAAIAENLWRMDVNKAQRIQCVQKWSEHFAARHEAEAAAKKARDDARAAKKAERQAAKAAAAADPTKQTEGPTTEAAAAEEAAEALEADAANLAQEPTEAEAEKTFVEQLAKATGQSTRAAYRDARLAKIFTADDLECFQHQKVGIVQMNALASVKDDEKRKAVIALVASGMDFPEAYKQVIGQDFDYKGTKADLTQTERAKAVKEKAPELTDDEWFEKECGEKAALIKADHAQYKADALLYREINEARLKFRRAVLSAMEKRKKAGVIGAFWFAVNRVISISHPKDVLFCDVCHGEGVTENGKPCSKCKGGGYLLRTEKYS